MTFSIEWSFSPSTRGLFIGQDHGNSVQAPSWEGDDGFVITGGNSALPRRRLRSSWFSQLLNFLLANNTDPLSWQIPIMHRDTSSPFPVGVKQKRNNGTERKENPQLPQLWFPLENLPLNSLLPFPQIATPKPGTKTFAHSAPPGVGASDLQTYFHT